MGNLLKTIPFYLVLIMTFGLAGAEKMLAGQAPDWFLKQFTGSLLDLFPGALTLSFFLIAMLEIGTALLLVVGLLKRQKPFLFYGVLLAQITFLTLGFGQRLTHQYEAAGSLFFFAVLTFIAGHHALAAD